MSPDAYLQMAATEATHWWFRARREILQALLAGLGLPAARAYSKSARARAATSACSRRSAR